MDLMSSQRVPHVLERYGYVIEDRVLGEGGFGKVKPAYSYGLGKWVAVKIINEMKAPPTYLSRDLPREINSMSQLDHPNIVSNIPIKSYLC